MGERVDFSGGVRGKYAASFADGSNVVLLDADAARWFPDSETVNRVLRALAEVALRENRKKAQ